MLSKNILYCTAHAIGERNGHGTQFEMYPSHSGQLQCCPPTIIPLSHTHNFSLLYFSCSGRYFRQLARPSSLLGSRNKDKISFFRLKAKPSGCALVSGYVFITLFSSASCLMNAILLRFKD